jgi:predicted esterase
MHTAGMTIDSDPPTVRNITVGRTARYALLGAAGPQVREVWFVCHGYAQLATRFIERFRPIASPSRLIIAPEGLSRFYPSSATGAHGPASQIGASWMTSEDRGNEVRDYIGYLDALYDLIFASQPRDAVAVCALGFSQGTSTVARWVAAAGARVDQVVLWAGSVPPELTRDEAARLGTKRNPLILVAGTGDRFISQTVLDSQTSALSALGVATDVVRFDGGHEVDSSVLRQVAETFSTRYTQERVSGD